MVGLLTTDQPLGERFTLPASNAPGLLGVLVADPGAVPAGVVAPFRATYYVDPAFVGVHTGSASNPFATIAAAFAAAALLGIASGIIFVPPAATITENVVFPPAAGTNWEIQCQVTLGDFVATIDGTVDVTAAGAAERAITNLVVNGAVTGSSTGGISSLRIGGAFIISDLTLTGAGGGSWIASFVGTCPPGPLAEGGASQGLTVVTGEVLGSLWGFLNVVSLSTYGEFLDCWLNGGVTNTNPAGPVPVRLIGCNCLGGGGGSGFVINGGGGGIALQADGFSIATLLGAITTKTANVQIFPSGMGSLRTTLNNNAGVFNLCNRYPTSLMILRTSLTLLVAGTLGAIQCNVTYTDMLGVLQTVNVGATLNAAGAPGTEVTGEFVFSQNGATNVQMHVVGIVTPGALSYSFAASLSPVTP